MTHPAPLHEILVAAPPGRTTGLLVAGGSRLECSLGRAGLVSVKREGDGGTPTGTFPLRALRYRADRLT
ncbi:MAG: hypothetical protein LPK88_12030, partial [Alphaproteobacteria bacterium]|nr:hypothetical protein [Alphaproteobacteria bacterium]MDX5417027.1 hypothetical protein [Alphaproteobacteria bacterium]MDX5494430.1 hypothetical protein [Alphaproteobacteria bacterium]